MRETTERRPGERLLIWFLLAFSILVLAAAWAIPHETLSLSGSFPIFIGSVMVLAVLRILWQQREVFSSWSWREELGQAKSLVFPLTVSGYGVILILYILLLRPLHFWASSYLFLVGSFLFLKGARPIKALIVGAVMLAVIWFLFQFIFRIVLW